jgi:hypothetical protein
MVERRPIEVGPRAIADAARDGASAAAFGDATLSP